MSEFNRTNKTKKQSVLITSIFVFITFFFFSCISPLYKVVPYDDLNIFFTIGRCMANGIIPYKDVFEQKGVYLYFFYAIDYLTSGLSHAGIWFIECVFAIAYTLINRKICLLFTENTTAALVYSLFITHLSYNFSVKDLSFESFNGSAEAFSLPLIAYALYIGVRALKDGTGLLDKDCFLIGLTASFVLWSKYTILFFYISWYIPFIVYALKDKQYARLFKNTGFILLGAVAGSVPAILYAVITHSLAEMFTVYFLYNMFGGYLQFSVLNAFNIIFLVILAIFYTALIKIKVKTRYERAVVFTLIATFYLTMLIAMWYYYFSILYPFFIFLLAFIKIPDIRKKPSRLTYGVSAAVIIGALCILYIVSPVSHYYYRTLKGETKALYDVAEIINSSDDTSTICLDNLDKGSIYMVADLLPTEYHYYPTNYNKEAKQSLDTCIQEQRVNFIIAIKMLETDEFYLERRFGSYYDVLENSDYESVYEGTLVKYDGTIPYKLVLYQRRCDQQNLHNLTKRLDS